MMMITLRYPMETAAQSNVFHHTNALYICPVNTLLRGHLHLVVNWLRSRLFGRYRFSGTKSSISLHSSLTASRVQYADE